MKNDLSPVKRFAPVKHTALDGKIWWCVFDFEKMKWSTLLSFGKYKTKKECQQAIDQHIERVKPYKSHKDVTYVTYIRIAEDLYRCSACGKIIECGDMNLLPVKCPHCGEEDSK